MRFALRTGVLLIALGAAAAVPAPDSAAEAWLQPETLSQPGTSNDRARIATNSPGVAAVIWTEFLGSRTPRFRVLVSTREPDGRWTPSEQLSAGTADAFAGDVGVDPQGRITAVFDEGGKMMSATKAPGQPWTTAQPIPDGDGGNADLFVASDGTEGDIAGNDTVSYTHDFAGGTQRQIIAVHRPNSGPWGTQTPLSGSVADNVSDLVVAPNSGQASVFWQDGNTSAPMAARTLATARGAPPRRSRAAPRAAWTSTSSTGRPSTARAS